MKIRSLIDTIKLIFTIKYAIIKLSTNYKNQLIFLIARCDSGNFV